MNENANLSPSAAPPAFKWVAWWIVICAALNAAGWILSAVHQLNVAGYVVLICVVAAGFFLCRKKNEMAIQGGVSWKKQRRRFRRPFPFAFLVLAFMAFIGGAMYAPNNYDALAYRLPRVLHWLAEGRWHWIHTTFERLNTRACGYEWVAAPLIALTKSDRMLFLIDVISFLLLPGLMFGVMRRLGVGARAAWHWMWLLPSGYCFLLQAGSIGNDMFSAVFALAALDFALRARTSRRVSDLWLSLLSVALLTGGKTSNLPMLLPWAIAVLPSLKLLKPRIPATILVCVLAALASFLPMAVLNFQNCGDWMGQAAERTPYMKGSPVLRVSQNIALLTVQNLVPPVFPWANRWNAAVLKVIPQETRVKLEASFEQAGAHLAVDEMQIEEEAGIGFGVTLLLLITFAATFFARHRRERKQQLEPFQKLLLLSAIACLGPYVVASGLTAAARLVTPYYALIVPVLLLWQSSSWIARNRWWQYAGLIVFAMAGMLVVISPSRPLWPAQTILSKLSRNHGGLVERATSVYSVYGERAHSFNPAIEVLPPGLKTLGLISADAPEASLWKPFGSRRVEHVIAADSAEYLHEHGIEYILINPANFEQQFTEPFEQWRIEHHAQIAQTIRMTLRVSTGPVDWLLIRVQ